MTAVEQPPATEVEVGNRVAGYVVLAVATAGAGAVAVVHPEAAYFVTGLLASAGVRKAHGWVIARRNSADEAEPVDLVAVLRDLAAGGKHVRLTQLQVAAGLPDTKAVRALLDEAGIPVRTGVRAGGKNGPGVHHDDVPPLPAPESDTSSGGCLCSSTANTNANKGQPNAVREGLSVEAIGQAGSVIRDPAERRAYTV
ncbi:hypothetical protein ACIOD1_12935 [Streptomyces sp. NPDC088097]|uniref:hypothetical protein n=1 Tax=Streptomyces sp. NPDC088097 TaxID=3365823 RepID=UPI0038195493